MPIIDVSWFDVLLAAGLLVGTMILSLTLRLKLERDLLVGMLRTVGQLAAAGVVLGFIFEWDRWYLVLLLLMIMLIVASWTALRRVSKAHPRKLLLTLPALALGSLLTTVVVAYGVVGISPWYSPRYLIPFYGMILGNSMTGVALALERFQGEIERRREDLELLLSLGATRLQAVREPFRVSLSAAMIPIINSLMVVGVVSLPGMMTGQILAGVAPDLAIRYQIVVMFMLAFAVAVSAAAALLGSYREYFTPAHQLNPALPRPSAR